MCGFQIRLVVGLLDLASGRDIRESSALPISHAQCMLRIAPDGVYLFLLAVIPADIKLPVGKARGILVHWTKYPPPSDLEGLEENY